MSVKTVAESNAKIYTDSLRHHYHEGEVVSALSPWPFIKLAVSIVYAMVQNLLVLLFKPPPPKVGLTEIRPRGRIAVIGAGLTGISSAAHAVAHGFDVVIFESGDKVGGIWSHVNSTSGLQLNSILYRFHPAVIWSRGFPFRDEILGEMTKIWKEYQLDKCTRFNTPVTSVRREDPTKLSDDSTSGPETDPNKGGHARWIVNDGSEGVFDAVIVTIGTCGAPKWISMEGMPEGFVATKRGETQTDGHSEHEEINKSQQQNNPSDHDTFKGPILHSSQLDSPEAGDLQGKTVVVIGSGASGVEAVETALARGANNCVILARDDKWIIPRNMFIDVLIAMQPFGREMPLSFLWELFLRKWHYRGVEDLTPAHHGLFAGTPVVNDTFLTHIRSGRCDYIRGDTIRLTRRGVLVNVRGRKSKPKDSGEEREIQGDVVVLATGFERPKIDFLPDDLFPEGYARPDLYLQNFSTEDWSILMTNSAYTNAIGTVGHFHIGIYTRILLTLLMDKSARPVPKDMKLWVDVVRFLKRGAEGGAFSFFTYMELTIWLLAFHVLRPDRLRWFFFIIFGWGVLPEMK